MRRRNLACAILVALLVLLANPRSHAYEVRGRSLDDADTSSAVVEVDAIQLWQSADIYIAAGQSIEIRVVDGLWTHQVGVVPYNNGVGEDYICADHMDPSYCVEPMPSVRKGSLIGKIGTQMFAIGSGAAIAAEESGTLYMQINDTESATDRTDNDGVLTVEVTTGTMRNVPYFSQRDPRWIDHPLRTDGVCSAACDTIGKCGCCLTSAAMIFNYYGSDRTPPSLSDCMDIRACPFYWNEGERCSQGHARWQNRYSFSWDRLEDLLRQQPALLQVTRGPQEQHWVLVLGGSGSDPANYIIHDPWPINGAAMKLNAYTAAGWQLAGLAVYTGQSVDAGAVAVGTEQSASSSRPRVVAANPEASAQEDIITVAEAQSLSASSVVSASAVLYRMTDVTMTVQLTATSTVGSVAEMLLWTDSMTETSWQPFSIRAELSASDLIYARVRDTADNVSSTTEETRFPVQSPPSAPWEVFLPLVLRRSDSSASLGS